MNTGNIKINCNLKANDIPKNINDLLYFSFNIYKRANIANATYIESHCPQKLLFSKTVGKNNMIPYVITEYRFTFLFFRNNDFTIFAQVIANMKSNMIDTILMDTTELIGK